VLSLWRVAGSRSATDSRDSVLRLLDADPGSLLLAEADGVLTGTVIAVWDGWRGNFYKLAVIPGSRRRGVATALVRAGEVRLIGLGAVRISAIAIGDEEPVRSLWTGLGYERQPGAARYVRSPTGVP
jgi:ribosomal protein S18 acetylase RimI-like enzyme